MAEKEEPFLVTSEMTKIILGQMEENIFEIKVGPKQGTGFFCKIPFPDKNNLMPVFITSNSIINKDILSSQLKEKIEYKLCHKLISKEINLNDRLKYTNEIFDTTIIEIKEKDDINNYLELDDSILNDILNNDNKNNDYQGNKIYALQYINGVENISHGYLVKIFEDQIYNFCHKCYTDYGSSGSPIINVNNYKVIGIHNGVYDNKFGIGVFLNFPIKEFIELNCNI